MKIATLLFAFFIVGTTPEIQNKLEGTQWSFVKIMVGTTVESAKTDCNTSLSFDKNGQFTGYSGWNHFNGNYSVKSKGKLTMDNPMRTKKAGVSSCKLGETLYDYFQKVNKYSIVADTLYLCTSDCAQLVYVKK